MNGLHPPFIDLNYEVLSMLKEGGMGAVYKVRHRLLDQTRIIKVIRPHLAGDEELAERFLREARAASRLRHPHIALLLDFKVDRDGHEMLVMEYIDGLNLQELLDRHGPPALGATVELARQALSALGYLHRQGLVHRDVSPDNLMLTRGPDAEPAIKLIDLGIAKLPPGGDPGLTHPGVFLGKPLYASPEQFLGEGEVDARSDVYSMGVVLYRLLTGHLPFTGKNRRELKTAHLFHPPRPFAETDPEEKIPEDLRQVVLRALVKDPAERIESAASFSRFLEDVARRFPFDPEDLESVLGPPPAPAAAAFEPEKPASEVTTRPDRPPVALSTAPSLDTLPQPPPLPGQEVAAVEAMAPVVPEAPPAASPPAPAGPRRRRAVGIAAGLVLAAGATTAAGVWLLRPEPLAPPVLQSAETGPAPAPVRPAPQRISLEPEPVPPRPAPVPLKAPPETAKPAASQETGSAAKRPPDPSALTTNVPEESPPPTETGGAQPAAVAEVAPPAAPPVADRPVRPLEPPTAAYPAGAVESGWSCKVSVPVTVGESGEVVKVGSPRAECEPALVREADPYTRLFMQAAREAAQRARFEPAIQNGVPVRATTTLVYVFPAPAPNSP